MGMQQPNQFIVWGRASGYPRFLISQARIKGILGFRATRGVLMTRSACLLALTTAIAFVPGGASANDVSAPAILQWFDSTYRTQRERVADFFQAGYGSTWIPPVGRADSGG